MIFSEQWLREWVNPPLTTQNLMDQLTMAGLEIDGCQSVAAEFSGVVVAEVRQVYPHPDAEKLRVCQVFDGTSTLQVVCGASNVRAGMRVPFAAVGAKLAGKSDGEVINIRQAKLRGVDSNGMLCSAQELGIADSALGLLELPTDAPLGRDIRDYLQLDDFSLELDLTPNRGDCLGIVGIAREIAALNGLAVQHPVIDAVPASITDSFPVKIEATSECPRYLGRVVKGVNPAAPTPLWMAERLRRSGLRCIDAVVDVTNYILLELGQPMHAFDLGRLAGQVCVRLARDGEKLVLLDGKEVTLSSDVLIIADDDRPLAMAGVMGGSDSGVGQQTTDVFLESAFFSPLAIAGRARRYGLHTDASHRYERGVDFEIQALSMERATALLLQIAGGQAGPVIEARCQLPQLPPVTLQYEKLARVLGLEIEPDKVCDILERLGVSVIERNELGITARIPSFRFDLSLDVDLIEEIARVYGYNNLPKTRAFSPMALGSSTETRAELGSVKDRLASLGYQEVITYSFVDPNLQHKVLPSEAAIALQNPISADMSVMRTSMWPGLLSTLIHNTNRQQERVRIFETGQIFHRIDGKTLQPSKIGGLIFGSLYPELWCNDDRDCDYFDLKGDVESILALSSGLGPVSFSPELHPALHPGQSAVIHAKGKKIGVMGALSPQLQREFGFNKKVYLFELDIESMLECRVSRMRDLSRFPEVGRDLAIVISVDVSSEQIVNSIRDAAGPMLVDLRIFDVYQGDAIEKNKKSVALGLTLQHPSRTLGDEDINGIIDSCVKELQAKFNAKLRN
jgi:phenylalanyl-tRNA synthetase beta chain